MKPTIGRHLSYMVDNYLCNSFFIIILIKIYIYFKYYYCNLTDNPAFGEIGVGASSRRNVSMGPSVHGSLGRRLKLLKVV